MQLILWRHAEAEDGIDDLARELTARGRRQAAAMGRWLGTHLPPGTRCLVSPAIRCQQTAAALASPARTDAGLAPDQGVQALLQAAGWPDAGGTVLVVGHQPTLGLVAAQLLLGEARPLSVRKGSILWLVRRPDAPGRSVRLHACLPPELAGA